MKAQDKIGNTELGICMFRNLLITLILCNLALCASSSLAEDAPRLSTDEIATLQEQAALIRKRIESGPPQFSLIGLVERGEDADYSVNNEDFIVDSTTRINGNFRVGANAQVRGERIGGRNYAKKIIVDKDGSVKERKPKTNNKESDAPFINDGPAGLPGEKPIKD